MTVAKIKSNIDFLHLGRVTTVDDIVLQPMPMTECFFAVPEAGDEVVVVDNQYYIGVSCLKRIRC